jgi:hypothetical protein
MINDQYDIMKIHPNIVINFPLKRKPPSKCYQHLDGGPTINYLPSRINPGP